MLSGFPGRSTKTFALVALTLGAAFVHCAHPTDDYESYLDLVKKRTSSSKPPAGCLGTPDTSGVDLTGTFVGYCRVNFASASQALRLATRFTQTGTTLEAKLTPLKTGAKTVNETVGDPELTATTDILEGKFSLDVGTVKVSGGANPISGSDIQLDNAVFEAVINSKDEILAELNGQLVKPFTLDLSDETKTDICLFVRLADGTTLPEPPPGEAELSCRNQGGGGSGGGGSGGSGGGGPCTDDGTMYCGLTLCQLPSISSCDDAMPSACAAAMCMTTDCKQTLMDCYVDEYCNRTVACGANCLAQDPMANTVAICGPLAGPSLGKALAYRTCAQKLTACGGDGSLDP
jgi:hypothetical protein